MAASAQSAVDGFLEPRQPPALGILLPFRVSLNKFGSFTVRARTFSDTDYIRQPVDLWAWTLQEQLLSSRLLLYKSHTLTWRCAAATSNLELSFHEPDERMPRLLSQLSTIPEDAIKEWARIICMYSSRSVSFHSDKLPTIAALAERFAPVLGTYYAGIWEYAFIENLLCVCVIALPIQTIPNPYRAPSWSWASSDMEVFTGFVSAVQRKIVPGFILLSGDIDLKHASLRYAEVDGGHIAVSGSLILVRLGLGPLSDYNLLDENGASVYLVSIDYQAPGSALSRFYQMYFLHLGSSWVLGSGVRAELYFDEDRLCTLTFVCK